jgi:hypothetical protein
MTFLVGVLKSASSIKMRIAEKVPFSPDTFSVTLVSPISMSERRELTAPGNF